MTTMSLSLSHLKALFEPEYVNSPNTGLAFPSKKDTNVCQKLCRLFRGAGAEIENGAQFLSPWPRLNSRSIR